MRRPLAASTAAAILGAAALAGSAPAATHSAATPRITGAGIGKVKVGASYASLRERGLVGRINHGCELDGPSARGANLKSPLEGSVTFTSKNPRKVTSITITGGASGRDGTGIGSTLADLQAAYPKAKVDHSVDDTLNVTLVRIPKSDGGRIMFGVDTDSGKTVAVGVPALAFCE